MAEGDLPSAREFGATFKQFLESLAAQASREEACFVPRLRDHFGEHPATLPIVTEEFVRAEPIW